MEAPFVPLALELPISTQKPVVSIVELTVSKRKERNGIPRGAGLSSLGGWQRSLENTSQKDQASMWKGCLKAERWEDRDGNRLNKERNICIIIF